MNDVGHFYPSDLPFPFSLFLYLVMHEHLFIGGDLLCFLLTNVLKYGKEKIKDEYNYIHLPV